MKPSSIFAAVLEAFAIAAVLDGVEDTSRMIDGVEEEEEQEQEVVVVVLVR